MKKLAWHLGIATLIGFISFWIVSNGHYYDQLKTEDVILNVFLTSLWILILSYLLSPVFRMIVRGFKNLKEGKKLFMPSNAPKKKISGLYKFLLLMIGFDLLFMLVKALLCAVDSNSCRSDGFGLYMIMFGALFIGIVVPWIIYKLVRWTDILKNSYAMLIFAVVAVAGIILEGASFYPFTDSLWALLMKEVSFLLNWLFFYLLGFGLCKVVYKKISAISK